MSAADIAYEDKHYIKTIDCPFDSEHKPHKAIVYQYPHRFAGIVECVTCGGEDGCEHEELRVESFTVDCMRNGEHDQYETPGYVCEVCECPVDGYEPEEPDHDE